MTKINENAYSTDNAIHASIHASDANIGREKVKPKNDEDKTIGMSWVKRVLKKAGDKAKPEKSNAIHASIRDENFDD